MDLTCEVTVSEHDDYTLINIEGDDVGAIIGRRGETLDAIQYLVSMVANRDSHDYRRIVLDSGGYREKRKNTLIELATKISNSVLKKGRSSALEPMNPYERRIIHSTVSEIEEFIRAQSVRSHIKSCNLSSYQKTRKTSW